MQLDKSERNTCKKSTFQTLQNGRRNLTKWEEAMFLGLGAQIIRFFLLETHHYVTKKAQRNAVGQRGWLLSHTPQNYERFGDTGRPRCPGATKLGT